MLMRFAFIIQHLPWGTAFILILKRFTSGLYITSCFKQSAGALCWWYLLRLEGNSVWWPSKLAPKFQGGFTDGNFIFFHLVCENQIFCFCKSEGAQAQASVTWLKQHLLSTQTFKQRLSLKAWCITDYVVKICFIPKCIFTYLCLLQGHSLLSIYYHHI